MFVYNITNGSNVSRGNSSGKLVFDWHLYFSLQNLCLIDYHITFFAVGSYAVTCRTHNINVVASSVQFVPKINCCGVNFCRHTNPNIALKMRFVGYQKMGNFQPQHTLYYFLLFTAKVVFVLVPYHFFAGGKLCCDLQNAQH